MDLDKRFSVDLLRNCSKYSLEKVRNRAEEANARDGDIRERLQKYKIFTAGSLYQIRPITKFLGVVPQIGVINTLVCKPATIDDRFSILPPDAVITANFKNRMFGYKEKAKSRWLMQLMIEHDITLPPHSIGFNRRDHFSTKNYIIIEDVLSKKVITDENNYLCRNFYIDNLSTLMEPIAYMPQDKSVIKKEDVAGMRRDLEGLEAKLGFDYRLLMYTLGVLMGQYLSKDELNIQNATPSPININISIHHKVSPGQIIFTAGCGNNNDELNTFCMITGLASANVILILQDRIVKGSQVLAGYSLYMYMCKLFKNIMYTSNMYGAGAEHLWAFMAGLHRLLKVYAHSDEGGAVRKVLSMPRYMLTCGMLQQAPDDVLGYFAGRQSEVVMQKRALLDMLFFFPNALSYSDTGRTGHGEYVPTVLQRHSDDRQTLQAYAGFSETFSGVLDNMLFLLKSTFNLTSTSHHIYNTYIVKLNDKAVDHHLQAVLIIPYQWVDTDLVNIYGFTHDKPRAHLSYYEDYKMEMFPKNTTMDYNRKRDMPLLRKYETVDIVMQQHVPRNYGYSYILNPIYNTEDGLSEMVISQKGEIATSEYMYNNFLYSDGDPLVGGNKWYTPHCAIPNHLELLCLDKELSCKLCVSRDRYYPHPDIMLSDKTVSTHRLSRMYPVAVMERYMSKTRYVPKRTALIVSEMMDTHFQMNEESIIASVQLCNILGNVDTKVSAPGIKYIEEDVISTNAPTRPKEHAQNVANADDTSIKKAQTLIETIACTSSLAAAAGLDDEGVKANNLEMSNIKAHNLAQLAKKGVTAKDSGLDKPAHSSGVHTKDETMARPDYTQGDTGRGEQQYNVDAGESNDQQRNNTDIEDGLVGRFNVDATATAFKEMDPGGIITQRVDNTTPITKQPGELPPIDLSGMVWVDKDHSTPEKLMEVYFTNPQFHGFYDDIVKTVGEEMGTIIPTKSATTQEWTDLLKAKSEYIYRRRITEYGYFSECSWKGGTKSRPDRITYQTICTVSGLCKNRGPVYGTCVLVYSRTKGDKFDCICYKPIPKPEIEFKT